MEEQAVLTKKITNTALAKKLGISRQSLYYPKKQPLLAEEVKRQIEAVLSDHPAYGHKRIALELKLNKKRILIPFLYRFKGYLFQAAKRAFCKAARIKSYPVSEAMHSAVNELKTTSIFLRSSSNVSTVNQLNWSLSDCQTRLIGLTSGL